MTPHEFFMQHDWHQQKLEDSGYVPPLLQEEAAALVADIERRMIEAGMT